MLDIGQVLFFAFLWTNDVNVQNLDRTSWSIKEFIIKNGQKENFFLRDFSLYAGNPERVRLAHHARRGSQSEHRNRFILPTRGFSHILKSPIVTSLSLGTVDAPFVSSPCTSDLREKFLHQDMTWAMMKRIFISNRRSPYRHHLVLILPALSCSVIRAKVSERAGTKGTLRD